MPNYTFRNKETNEEITVNMSMAEHDTYLNDKPDWEQIIQSATVCDPWTIGVSKPPSDFTKYVLGKVKAKTAGADAVGTGRWNIPKEI